MFTKLVHSFNLIPIIIPSIFVPKRLFQFFMENKRDKDMNTIQNNKKNNNNKVGDLTVLKIKTYRS